MNSGQNSGGENRARRVPENRLKRIQRLPDDGRVRPGGIEVELDCPDVSTDLLFGFLLKIDALKELVNPVDEIFEFFLLESDVRSDARAGAALNEIRVKNVVGGRMDRGGRRVLFYKSRDDVFPACGTDHFSVVDNGVRFNAAVHHELI